MTAPLTMLVFVLFFLLTLLFMFAAYLLCADASSGAKNIPNIFVGDSFFIEVCERGSSVFLKRFLIDLVLVW